MSASVNLGQYMRAKSLCVGGTKVSSIYKALHHASAGDSRDIQTCLVLFIYLFLSRFVCRVRLVLTATLRVAVSSCKLLLLHIKIYILMSQCLYSTLGSLVAPSGAPRRHKFQVAALWFWRASWVFTWPATFHPATIQNMEEGNEQRVSFCFLFIVLPVAERKKKKKISTTHPRRASHQIKNS